MEIKNQNVDNVVPKSKWEFDADVAHCFANMLERSIPDYRSMRSLVYELGERFIKPQTVITDIGCSTGLAVEPFFNKHGDNNAYFLCDNSEAMIEVCRDQMKRENGYTEEKIMQKRKSLENVLSPLKAEWNEDMLHEAGFEKVDMFWRCLNFCGWVAIK